MLCIVENMCIKMFAYFLSVKSHIVFQVYSRLQPLNLTLSSMSSTRLLVSMGQRHDGVVLDWMDSFLEVLKDRGNIYFVYARNTSHISDVTDHVKYK